jgi:hypothetical protein
MIIGNPANFAVFIDLVTDWNDESSFWREGVIDFIFQYKFLADEIRDFTLNEFVTTKDSTFLKMPIENKELFFKEKYAAFKEMLDNYQPLIMDDEPEDFFDDDEKYHTGYILNDSDTLGKWVTIVRYQDQVRILGAIIEDWVYNYDKKGEIIGGEWVRRENLIIREAIVSMRDYLEIDATVVKYHRKYVPCEQGLTVPLF